jgi:Uma2 family endonuclease
MQFRIGTLLEKLMPPGNIVTECPVSTADGVKGVDVAWASSRSWGEVGNRTCFLRAPEICVEVASPSNSEGELREKMALYSNASAKEVWFCSVFGEMTFHQPTKQLAHSELCSLFPNRI